MTDWDRLVAAFPPPRVVARAVDWAAFENEFGISLPTDYKLFIDSYGHGRFNGFLTVFLPFSPYEFVELDVQRSFAEGKADFWLEYEQVGSTSLPVDPRQLLPVAGTDNGNTVYWNMRTPGAPDDWTIAVDQARNDQWYLFEGGIVSFLVATFVDRLRVPVFPEDLSREASSFVPVD